MRASEGGVDRQTVQRLLFARLLVRTKRALTRDEIVRSVAQVLAPRLSKQVAEKTVRDELARCEGAGWVADVASGRAHKRASNGGARGTKPASTRRVASRLALTSKAQALAFALFGGESMPTVRDWEHGQQLAALSQIGRAAAAEKTMHVDELAAVILGERKGAPPELEKIHAVVDYLAWRELGVETTARFDVDAVQRYLLRGIVPHDVRVSPMIWRRMLAMRVAGADSPDAPALVRALLALKPQRGKRATQTLPARSEKVARQPRAAKRARPKGASPVANDNAPRTVAQPTLADFATAVRNAARLPAVVRFHDDRAFIGSVWEQMRRHGLLGGMSLDEFKARLIAAHRDGLLRITRADLVAAMDPNELERSEARYQNATFHFVALEAGGSR